MKGKETRLPLLYKTMMYVCGMFLFLEWIYPIKNYGEENNLRIFIIFTLFCFLISLVQLKWYVSFLLKGSGLLIMINMLYYDHDLFNGAWLYQLIRDRKSTRLNSSHVANSYAVFCLKQQRKNDAAH